MFGDNWGINFKTHHPSRLLFLFFFGRNLGLYLDNVKKNCNPICGIYFVVLTFWGFQKVYFRICNTLPRCQYIQEGLNKLPEGWTYFPGCAKPVAVRMLLSDHKLSLNQRKLCQQQLRATIICPIDRWVVHWGLGDCGKGKGCQEGKSLS